MNYIKHLQADKELLTNSIEQTKESINEFREYLASSKFNGTDLDGSDKNWINAKEVDNELRRLLYLIEGN